MCEVTRQDRASNHFDIKRTPILRQHRRTMLLFCCLRRSLLLAVSRVSSHTDDDDNDNDDDDDDDDGVVGVVITEFLYSSCSTIRELIPTQDHGTSLLRVQYMCVQY